MGTPIVEIDFSFLEEGSFKVELFKDGINANRAAKDYKRETMTIPTNRKMNIEMKSGGGFVMRIYKE